MGHGGHEPGGHHHDGHEGGQIQRPVQGERQPEGQNPGENGVGDHQQGPQGWALELEQPVNALVLRFQGAPDGGPLHAGQATGPEDGLELGVLDQPSRAGRAEHGFLGVFLLDAAQTPTPHQIGEGQADCHHQGQPPVEEEGGHKHGAGNHDRRDQVGQHHRCQVREDVHLAGYGGCYVPGGPGPEPAQGESRDPAPDLRDQGAADVDDADAHGNDHADPVHQEGGGSETYQNPQPRQGGRRIRAQEGPQEGNQDHEGQALQQRGDGVTGDQCVHGPWFVEVAAELLQHAGSFPSIPSRAWVISVWFRHNRA